MDHRNGRGKKTQAKKKVTGKDAPVVVAHEQRMIEEEERLVRLTIELSLKEAADEEARRDVAEEADEVVPDTPFVAELKNCLFTFDPALLSLIDSSIEPPPANNSSTSLPQLYFQQLLPGGREKLFKEKLQVALLLASILGYPRIVSYLIERGADPSVKTMSGWTSMHWAASLGHVAVVRVLLAQIPIKNLMHEYKDKAEMTPLDVLAQELEQIPVKIPLEVLKVFGRWRNQHSSESSASASADASAFTAPMFKANQMEYLSDEAYEEYLKSSSELADSAHLDDDTEEAALAAEDAEAQRRDHPPSQLFAWGSSAVHLQGHGDMAPRSNPKRVASLESEDVIALSTSQFMSAAVTSDGKAYVWGLSDAMRLGTATSNAQETNPIQLPASSFDDQLVSSVSLSNYHGAFVTQDGVAYTFGRGREGQLGLGQSLADPSALSESHVPPTLSYLNKSSSTSSSLSDSAGKRADASKNPFGSQSTTSSSSSSDSYTAELKPAGGDPYAHALGRVKLGSRMKPSDPQFFVTQIACSDSHTAILTQAGGCWTFGNGSKGQLGHDNLKGEHSPRQVRAIADYRFRHVSVGPTHTVLATKTDLWFFGFNNPSPRRQAFAFGNPSRAVRLGLLPSFAITALASGPSHFLVLTREGDVFSWLQGIDKFPVPINVDMKQLEKTRQQYEASLAHSGFSIVHSGSSDKNPISLSGLASTDHKSGIDRERHHVVSISVVGSSNYLTTSDGLVFSFSNAQRRMAAFPRLPVQPRLRLFAPGRSHFLAAIDRPLPPRESTRPPVPPRLLPQHLQNIYEHQSFTDVEIECQGEIRRAHRFILSVSPVLASTFLSAQSSSASTISAQGNSAVAIIKLPESTPLVALDLLLSFIYYGQFLLPETYKDKDMRKVLCIKPQDKDALVALALEWDLPTIAELIQEGKAVANAHLVIQSSEEESSDSDVPVAINHRAWIRHLQNHLATHIANPVFADAILVVGTELHTPHQTHHAPSSPAKTKASSGGPPHNDTEIPIHRALVVERSEWLRMTLSMSSGWTESQSQKIAMSHLRPHSARAVLSYLYTDSLPNRDAPVSLESLQILTDLTATADELLLPELKLIVARRLSRALSPENVSSVLDVAETYGAEDLFECIIRWIASNVELLLRLGALPELTYHQMDLVEQVVLEERGVQPWRYFKTEIEEKVLKLATTALLGLAPSASHPEEAAPASSVTATEEVASEAEHAATSSSASSASSAASSAQNAPEEPKSNAYVPPNRRRAIQEEQRQTAELFSSPPSGKSSFAQIQLEQMQADSRVAAAAAAAVQKQKNMFTWASSSPGAGPAQPAIVNQVLTSKATSLWPELPMAAPAPAPVVEELPAQEASSAPAPASAASSLPVPAPKKNKVLKSPLRDPKQLTEKDAVFTAPKPASSTPEPANAKNSAKTSASTAPVAQTADSSRAKAAPKKSSAAEPQAPASAPQSAKMSASVAEYVPSGAKATNPAPAPANPKQGRGGKKSGGQQGEATAPASTQNQRQQHQQPKNKQKGQSNKNELGGAMKPSSTKPAPRTAQKAPALTADEELAIAISRSLAETSMTMEDIQREESVAQTHRGRGLKEIQEEERQLEEQRALEAYFAAKHAEQQAIKESQSAAPSEASAPSQAAPSNNRRPNPRNNNNKGSNAK